MIAEALKLLFETGQKAKAVKILDVPGDGRTCFLDEGGQLREIEVAPPLRDECVGLLSDVIQLALTAKGDSGSPVVWYAATGVTLVVDAEDRRDHARMTLTFSPQLLALMKLEDEMPQLEHREFIQLLRLKLGLPSDVVDPFRRIDWQNAHTARGAIGRGKESLGRTIEAQVQGIDKLPERIDVPVPVFDAPGERACQLVRCSVEIDVHNHRLTLIPEPTQIGEAIDRALASIRQRLDDALQEAKIPVFYGAP